MGHFFVKQNLFSNNGFPKFFQKEKYEKNWKNSEKYFEKFGKYFEKFGEIVEKNLKIREGS